MNKFCAFVLFALVAGVACSPVPENAETELLIGNEKLFGDFCVAQGQKIKSDLNEFSRQTSAEVTKIFFGNVNEITDDVIRVQKEAVAQLTAKLAKPDSQNVDEDETLSEDEIARLIKEGKQAIQETNGVAGVLPATKATFSAMLSTVNSAVFTRLAKARSFVSGINLYEQFKNACAKVAAYEAAMEAALEEVKEQLLAQNEDAEVQKSIKEITVTNLNCFTTKNIVRLHGFCDTVQAGHKYFFKMLGMESPLNKYE